jgi:predicted transcriptional regulator YheO
MKNKVIQKSTDGDIRTQVLFSVLEEVFNDLARTMGPNCEVTLLDLRKPVNRSIIKIKNGYITGRNVGGPLSSPGRKYMHTRNLEDLQLDDLHTTKTGRIIKGSISIFYDDNKEPLAMLSLIFDLTDIIKLNNAINDLFGISERSLQAERTSLFLDEALNKMSQMANEIIAQTGKPVAEMTRQDKIDIIKQLQSLGFFKVKGAVKIISDKLNSSKFTVYSYLNSSSRHI